MPRKRATNGSGTQPRRRSDGRWEVRYIRGTDKDGHPIRRSVYGSTALEAAEKLRAATASIDAGTYTDPCRMMLSQWLDIWLSDYCGSIKPGTLKGYRDTVNNRVKPALGAIRLCDLRPHTVQGFINALTREESLAPKTVRNIHGVLSKALSEALRVRYIATNPAAGCILPKKPHVDIMPFQAEEIVRFLEAIKGNPSEDIFYTALYTGMRLSEILGLRWSRVDFEAGTITVDGQMLFKHKGDARSMGPTKTGRPRSFAPAPAVMERLRAVERRQKEWRLRAGALWNNPLGLVFTDELGSEIPHTTVEHRFRRIMEKLSLSRHRFHDLRHTFATEAIRAGIDPKTVSDILGHTSVAFTLDVYAGVTRAMYRDAAARMQALIDSQNI